MDQVCTSVKWDHNQILRLLCGSNGMMNVKVLVISKDTIFIIIIISILIIAVTFTIISSNNNSKSCSHSSNHNS